MALNALLGCPEVLLTPKSAADRRQAGKPHPSKSSKSSEMPASFRGAQSALCVDAHFNPPLLLARKEGTQDPVSDTSAYLGCKPVARRRRPGCWAGCAACDRQQPKFLPGIASDAFCVVPQPQDAHSDGACCQIFPAMHCTRTFSSRKVAGGLYVILFAGQTVVLHSLNTPAGT